MARKQNGPSQLMELFLTVAKELGFSTDREVAGLADVGHENVTNWRTGAVKEFKTQKFRSALANVAESLRGLRAQAGLAGDRVAGISPLEIEDSSSPSDLHRQFRDRVAYDYLGHRFLYFEPQGALAWENLIKAGYQQECWLAGVQDCAERWLDSRRDGQGQVRGPLAALLGLGRTGRVRGLDMVSLGPGEGGKEMLILGKILDALVRTGQRPNWLSFVPIDVSIALLLEAARAGRSLFASHPSPGAAYRSVLPFCADFEEGELAFCKRLRSSPQTTGEDARLILVLGNVMGNLRDEEAFVRRKLWKLTRPGDLVWIEVGLRPDNIADDPLFRLTEQDLQETASDANRRLLLEGPYRRWASAIGRPQPQLGLRIWVRDGDDSARVPGSCNFCHDLQIKDEGRAVTMLYSRRYRLEDLTAWFESFDFSVQGISRVADSNGNPGVAHLLLKRVGATA